MTFSDKLVNSIIMYEVLN